MPFTIQNRARHLLVLPLNSGGTLHLAPGETSPPIEDFELDNNAKVERLMTEGLITASPLSSARPTKSRDAGADEDDAQADPGERRRGGRRN